MNWELIESYSATGYMLKRAKVPGGWLLQLIFERRIDITFYPDPQHQWNGKTLP